MGNACASGLPRLKNCGFWIRVAVSIAILGILGGYGVAGYYLRQHYENRDERPGLTMTDIQGAYAGVTAPAIMLPTIEGGHPDTMSTDERTALIDWLSSDTTRQDYDNFDLEYMPEDIIQANCLSCHSRGSTGETAFAELPLEYWDDIEKLATSTVINPKDMKIVVASIHAHLPSMAMVLLMVTALAACTRWSGCCVGFVSTVAGLGLLADFGCQVYASVDDPRIPIGIVIGGIVIGGMLYAGGVVVLGLSVLGDCWLPGGRGSRSGKSSTPGEVPDGVPLRRPV